MFKGLNLYIPMITQSTDMFFSIIFFSFSKCNNWPPFYGSFIL